MTETLLHTVAVAVTSAGLRSSDQLVVGLSGGADSLALTQALLQLERTGDGPRIFPVHVDHRLRQDSAEAARRVSVLGERLGREVQIAVVDCARWDAALGQGVEGSARAARYAALAEAALELGSQWMAVAHNADDQAESVLLAMCRGASTAALAGMQPCSSRQVALDPAGTKRVSVNVIRPLLSVRRSIISEFLQSEHLEPIEDPSNDSTRFLRNALRHNVLPHIEAVFPGAVEAIQRSAGALRADDEFLELQARRACHEIHMRSIEGCRLIPRDRLNELPAALRRRLLWSVLRELNVSGTRIKQERIEAILTGIAGPDEGRIIEIVGGLVVYLDYDVAAIGPRERLVTALRRDNGLPLFPPWTTVHLAAGNNEFRLAGNQILTIEVQRDRRQRQHRLQLRTRRPGDQIGPGNRQRLQDLLVDRRVPRYARDWLPLVASGPSVEWIAGLSPDRYSNADGGFSLTLERRLDAQSSVEAGEA